MACKLIPHILHRHTPCNELRDCPVKEFGFHSHSMLANANLSCCNITKDWKKFPFVQSHRLTQAHIMLGINTHYACPRIPRSVSCVAGGFQETASVDSLAEGYGWQVRDVISQEALKAVAAIQALVFYEPSAFGALDVLFFDFFKAEVLDSLVKKVKYSPPDRYTCLMAVPSSISHSENSEVVDAVGVVDLTALQEMEVLRHLHGVDEYLYLSGMAVKPEQRKSKVATVLLDAVEVKALQWGFEYLVLHVHEDNIPARRLYQKAGYLALDSDPIWSTKLLGRKRRVLMTKRTKGYLERYKEIR